MAKDQEPEKPPTDWIGGFSVAAIFLSGVFAGVTIAPDSELSGVLSILFACGYLFACLHVHEHGHAIGARLAGWRVHAICVGKWVYSPATRRKQRASYLMTGERAGWTLATPADGDWEKGRALFYAGGPLANLLAAAGAVALALLIPGSWLAAALEGFAISSAVIGLLNLVPVRQAGRRGSDGAQLLDIARGEKQDPLTGDISLLFGAYFDGIAAKDWDGELVRRVEDASPGNPPNRGRDVMLVMRYLSQGAFRRAYDYLERAKYDGAMATLLLHHAFLVALVTRDAARARTMLTGLHRGLRDLTSLYRRAEAAVLALEGKQAKARQAALKWRSLAERYGEGFDAHEQRIFFAIERGDPLPCVVERLAEAA
jgi:hypothetical protein